MSRPVTIAAVQSPPHRIGAPFERFAAEARRAIAVAPEARILVFPELHLFGTEGPAQLRDQELRGSAEPLDGPLATRLAALAKDLGIWLVPGSMCELGPHGELFNTALVFSPAGERAAYYRKVFPWRPYEPYDAGDRFVVFDIDGVGRFGLSICYDAWFPEMARHLAWAGAEVILNIVKTTTADRAQELVLARANAIVNQVFMVSVNCAGPEGMGQSLIVDPEGHVRVESADRAPTVLADTLDLDHVTRVRESGTAGLNRPWSQFSPTDAPIRLPLYDGRIDPISWSPRDTLTP